jgi:hypothetical protein
MRGVLPVCCAIAVCVGGCGADTAEVVVARVGSVAITAKTLEHWTNISSVRRRAGDSSQRRDSEDQALRQLLSREWLLGEIAKLRVKITSQELTERVNLKVREAFPGGEPELTSFLKISGETQADLMSEADAEVASEKLYRIVTGQAAPVTESQIAAYYHSHKASFAVPEQRVMLITDRKSARLVDQIMSEVRAGRSFATIAHREVRPVPSPDSAAGRVTIEAAIRVAHPHVLTGPVKQHAEKAVYDYFVFLITHVEPATFRPLSQVHDEIGQELSADAERLALARFMRTWQDEWTAVTACEAGYVVSPCRQHRGPLDVEDPFTFRMALPG